MKHTLSTTDLTILEHIVFVAEKSAKTVQFYFKKGTEQTYITPKKDLLVIFNLSEPIGFDYPVIDLKKFIATYSPGAVDLKKNTVDISSMVIHTQEDAERFKTDVVQELDFTFDDLQTNQRLKKYKHLNILGEKNKCIFRYQNHEKSWWFDDGNKKIIEHGKSSRKFRYVMQRDKLRLLPNDYKLILRETSIQFQYKHLNYYFLPDVSWKRQSVKDWTTATSIIDDKHLIEQYRKKGYPKLPPIDNSIVKHASEKDYDKVNMIFQPYKKDYFPHLRKDYLTRMIKSGNVILDKEVVITYNQYKRKTTISNDAIALKGDCVLHQIASKKHNGSASDVLQRFFKFVNARVFLTVRSSNMTAKKFYEKNGMKLVGHTSWSNGTLLGDVYLLERQF
jgi:hypothetical protein